MPCGGIYSVAVGPNQRCFVCNAPDSELFCDEWDCFLHRRCLGAFLISEEGRVVTAHGHAIQMDEDGFFSHEVKE